jgi:hypothetical protein
MSPPVPVKWFYDRNSSSLVVLFSEPIDLIDCSGLHLSSQYVNMTLQSCDPIYLEFGTKLLLDLHLSNFSYLSSHQGIEALQTTQPGELWMRIANGTISDVVSDRNKIANWFGAESSPGETISDSVYITRGFRLLSLSSWDIRVISMHFVRRSGLSILPSLWFRRVDI